MTVWNAKKIKKIGMENVVGEQDLATSYQDIL